MKLRFGTYLASRRAKALVVVGILTAVAIGSAFVYLEQQDDGDRIGETLDDGPQTRFTLNGTLEFIKTEPGSARVILEVPEKVKLQWDLIENESTQWEGYSFVMMTPDPYLTEVGDDSRLTLLHYFWSTGSGGGGSTRGRNITIEAGIYAFFVISDSGGWGARFETGLPGEDRTVAMEPDTNITIQEVDVGQGSMGGDFSRSAAASVQAEVDIINSGIFFRHWILWVENPVIVTAIDYSISTSLVSPSGTPRGVHDFDGRSVFPGGLGIGAGPYVEGVSVSNGTWQVIGDIQITGRLTQSYKYSFEEFVIDFGPPAGFRESTEE